MQRQELEVKERDGRGKGMARKLRATGRIPGIVYGVGVSPTKVDTDEHVEPSDYFQVIGLPTLVVLDPGGREIYRLEGMIETDELARKLNELAESKKE